MANSLAQLMEDDRRAKLAREYSHPSSGYNPSQEEIQQSIDVGMGRLPQDIAYGERGLGGGFDIAEIGGIPINATDFIPSGLFSKGALLAGTAAAPLGAMLGINAMSKLKGVTINPNRLAQLINRQAGAITDIKPPPWNARQSVPLGINPTPSEIRELLRDEQAKSAYNTLRTLRDEQTGKLYAWPADAALHQDIGNIMKINPQYVKHGLIAP